MEEETNRLIAQRREKLSALRAQGQAFPNDFRRDVTAAELHAAYGERSEASLANETQRYALGGRMMAKRVMGKASFTHLQDGSGRIQVLVQRDAVGDETYRAFKSWDIGDIVGVTGTVMRTRTGELTVRAEQIRLLAKSLRPLPEKWAGLTDTETRYRQRYLDLIINPRVRETFATRSRVIRFIRQFLDAIGFIEAETPMLHPIPGGAAARPFVTHYNALDRDVYLRIAPELYLKRLVVGGFEKVYELGRNFRNEGVSTRHNPEFTMLELYQAYARCEDMMDLLETLLRDLAIHVLGQTTLRWQEQDIDLGPAFARVDLAEAVCAANGDIDPARVRDRGHLAEIGGRLGIAVEPGHGWGRILTDIFEKTVEPTLIAPTFVTGYPTEVSPLARRSDADPELTERFELFVGGREIANGFSELNDPDDQAARFREQAAAHAGGDDEAMRFDADYIRALEYGLPPTAGAGLGIDRLVMMLTDSPSIRDVLLFPQMRPEA